VLIVDDHPVVREGIVAILGDDPDIQVIGQAGSGEEALEKVTTTRPDVVVMDSRLPGISGAEACLEMARRQPSARVIIVTSFPNEGAMMAAFDAQARGFLLKGSEPIVIRQAVRTVADGGTYTDPRLAARLVALATRGRRAKGPFDLTLQEMRVVELLPRGMTNREIGTVLGVSEHTVKTHLYNAMHKLGAKDRAEAAAIALREGLA
jgi:DNA-binding NarL/FixJ family response regulator